MLRWWRSLSEMDQLAIVLVMSAATPILIGVALTIKLASGNY